MTQSSVILNLFKKFSSIIKDITKIVQQDAIYGVRLGKTKLKELKIEQKKLQKLIEIGRKTYSLYKKGLITDEQLKILCNQLNLLEINSKKYHTLAQEYKNKIKL